jgi:hypothetical protein
MKNITWKMLLLAAVLAVSARAETTTNSAAEPQISITPIATIANVKGNAASFREQLWEHNGWTGGVQEFTLEHKLPKDWNLTLTGRAIVGENDYKAGIAIEKEEVGFLRAGFSQYRQYFNNYGGYYSGFTTPTFALNQDLGLYVGDIFVDFGLQIPEGPMLTGGYERQYRTGSISLLQWGAVTEGGTTKNIYPSFRDVDETTDIIKLGLAHHVSKINYADDFRFEHYHSDNTTYDQSVNLDTASSQNVTIHEDYTYDLFNNVFRLDCQMNDKFYWSGGFLYSQLNGGGNEQVSTVPFTGNAAKDWSTSGLDYDQQSYVLNANASYNPFKKFGFYAGLQFEHTSDTGNTDALLSQISGGVTNNPLALINTQTDKNSVGGTIGARFTAIPFTTVYAEGKWTSDNYSLHQNQDQSGTAIVDLDQTDSVFCQKYTVGFNSAPLRRVTLSSYYRYSNNNHNYSYGSNIPDGYPGFLTGQEFANNEVMARIGYRPFTKLSLGLQYRYVNTDINNSQMAAASGFVPAGSLLASTYNANIFTVSATYSPFARLYLMGSASLQYTRTTSFDNGTGVVTPYTGNINTYTAGLGYAVDEKTDATVDYVIASAQNAAGNPIGLPLGWNYHTQSVNVNLTRRINERFIARLRYGFYDYIQQSGGDQNNYWANIVTASCTMRF